MAVGSRPFVSSGVAAMLLAVVEKQGGKDGDERGGEERDGDADCDEFPGNALGRRGFGKYYRGNVGRKRGERG